MTIHGFATSQVLEVTISLWDVTVVTHPIAIAVEESDWLLATQASPCSVSFLAHFKTLIRRFGMLQHPFKPAADHPKPEAVQRWLSIPKPCRWWLTPLDALHSVPPRVYSP